MRSSFRFILWAAAMCVAAIMLSSQSAQADALIVRPGGSINSIGNHNDRGDVNTIYMNRNQLLIRITGCEYGARVTNVYNPWNDTYCDDGNGNPRHWTGSGMGFIESIVNDKLLGAETDVTTLNGYSPALHVQYTTALSNANGNEPIFRNYVDLLLKRLLDGDTLTALDFDRTTFRYVDTFNPAITASALNSGPRRLYDTNGDGVEGGWEISPVLSGTCLAIPFIGDVCLNMYLVNVEHTITINAFPATYGTGVSAMSVPAVVNNIGAPMINFDSFDFQNQFNTSHLFLASEPKREFSFDDELQGCDTAELLTSIVNCNDNPYRDDDDGLYVEIKLTNVELGTLFEPPFTEAAMGTSAEVFWDGTAVNPAASNDLRHSFAFNITDIPESGAGNFPCPDGTVLALTDGEDDPNYDPACDLSTYLKATGVVQIPQLTLGLGLRIVSSYANGANAPATGPESVTGASQNIGIEFQSLFFDAQFSYNLNPGPFCTALVQGQDFVGVFYDQTDNPNNCPQVNPEEAAAGGSASVLDDATYLVSTRFASTVTFAQGDFLGEFEDFFDPSTNPGFFLGPLQLLSLDDDLLNSPLFDNPLAATHPTFSTDAVWLQLALDSNVDAVTVEADFTPPDNAGDYNYLRASGQDVVGDNSAEFWADPWGVLLPFSGGLGIYWSQDTASVSSSYGPGVPNGGYIEMVSCVKSDPQFTGYVDGITEDTPDNNNVDDASVSRPLPNLALNWSGSSNGFELTAGSYPLASTIDQNNFPIPGPNAQAPEYDSMLLHLRIPDVNYLAPFTSPAWLRQQGLVVPRAADPLSQETYAFGLALHQNFLSKALYDAVVDGLLCIDIDPVGRPDLFGNADGALFDLSGILTTDLFGLFVPYLADQFPGAPMAIRVIPLLRDPAGNTTFQTGAANYPSVISEFVRNFAAPSDATVSNPIPRIVMGGLNQFQERKKRFRGQIATRTILEATCPNQADDPNPLTNPTCGIWPDLSVVIPHLLVEFYVVDDTVTPAVRRRAFALDVGLNIGINIDVIQDIVLPGGPQQPTLLDQGGFPVNRPVYTGTDYPIGCDNSFASLPCEKENVPSRLVLSLGGIADPTLNAILVYDEMAAFVTDFAGNTTGGSVFPGAPLPCAGPEGEEVHPCGDAFEAYEDSIANLLGLLLSGEISGLVEIGIDPGALLNIPIVLTVPYIGPSFVWNDEADTAPGSGVTGLPLAQDNLDDSLGCGYIGVGDRHCSDPLFNNNDALNPISRDVSDGDANGFGDYLVVALGLDLQYLDADFLLRFADSIVEPLLYPHCEGAANGITDITCLSETFTNPLSELGLFAPGFAPAANGEFPIGYVSPETIIKGVTKAHGMETLIEYEGWHPTDDPSTLTFSYRVDGGLWTPFVPATTARIPGLLEGRHVFEVRAMDQAKNVEYTPERVVFVVDSVAPRVSILGDRVQGRNSAFVVDVRDAQTLPEDIRVSFKLDDGEWSPYSYAKTIEFFAEPGAHTLAVRAMDESGNVGESVLTIAVEEGGFGCAAAPSTGKSGALDLLVILLPVAVVFFRRRFV